MESPKPSHTTIRTVTVCACVSVCMPAIPLGEILGQVWVAHLASFPCACRQSPSLFLSFSLSLSASRCCATAVCHCVYPLLVARWSRHSRQRLPPLALCLSVCLSTCLLACLCVVVVLVHTTAVAASHSFFKRHKIWIKK